MLRGVQEIGIIMSEFHPPKQTLHFQTREYIQDFGCHIVVCNQRQSRVQNGMSRTWTMDADKK